jgi:hypothetical protein
VSAGGVDDAGSDVAGFVSVAAGFVSAAGSDFESVEGAGVAAGVSAGGGVTIAVSVGAAGAGVSGFVSGAGPEAGAGSVTGVAAAGGVTAAVEAGASGFGGDETLAFVSFGGSDGVGIAAVVAGLVFDGTDASCPADSAAATGISPAAQQTPNKLMPRRRSALILIIPRLAPIGERRGDASMTDTT